MLTQENVDYLIKVLKTLKTKKIIIPFPSATQQETLEAQSVDANKDEFLFYINRKGQYNLKKCTYISRYNNSYNLLRLDIDGPPHDNPDGTTVKCPHIHIYKEGYNLAWAYPLSTKITTNTKDLIQVLIDFLKYNNVKITKEYYFQEGELI